MSKIHVLPDENLGGVLREYVEVDREANVGDKIVIVNPHECQFGDSYTKGTIMSVEKANEDGDVYCGKFDIIEQSEYQTLEPTDIVHVDGKRYRMIDRKAKEGETVIVFGHSNENGNGVFKVDDVYKVNDAISYVGKDMRNYAASSEDYRVLEPLAEKDEAPKSVLDLLALPDEKLNGILREYIEVERKANAGEKIIGKNTGNIYTVLNVFSSLIETDTRQRIHHRDYFVLEPTDIVRIDGKRYRMVDREAKVGDKIIIVKNLEYRDWFKIGEIAIVEEVDSNGDVFADFNENKRVYGDGKWCVGRFYYYVLEPLHTCENCSVDCVKADDELPKTTDNMLSVDESAIDLLANLARRVTKLERENKELRHQSHNHRLDIEQIYIDVKSLRENVDVLDERTQPLLALIKAVNVFENPELLEGKK